MQQYAGAETLFIAMHLSLFSDYSLRVLMFGALPRHGVFSLDEVAAHYRISRHHVVKVVNFLAREGFLLTRRGRGGGISLARRPEEITLGQVVRLTESGPPLVECLDEGRNRCPISPACRLKGTLAEAMAAFHAVLDRCTLADITGNHASLTALLTTRSA